MRFLATAPVGIALLVAVVGLLTILLRQPWLFPSLGPTAYTQIEAPDHPTSRFHHVLIGHYVGLSAGALVVELFGLKHPASIFYSAGDVREVLAGATAVMITSAINLLLDTSHPPALATTLIVVLGGFPLAATDMLAVAGGVAVIAIVGEPLRRWRLRLLRSEVRRAQRLARLKGRLARPDRPLRR